MEALLIIGKVAGIELCKCEIWVLGPVGGHIVVNELLHEVRAVYVPGPRSKLSSKATMVLETSINEFIKRMDTTLPPPPPPPPPPPSIYIVKGTKLKTYPTPAPSSSTSSSRRSGSNDIISVTSMSLSFFV